jgi:cytoskeletal protein CcmA (bactofilin family)
MDFSPDAPLAGYLGPGSLWTGEIAFEGRLRVDGTFRGKLFSEQRLEIGPGGTVEGQVDVDEAVVAGVLKGRLRVRSLLVIETDGRVEGELIVGRIEQRRGATLQARVRRSWEQRA